MSESHVSGGHDLKVAKYPLDRLRRAAVRAGRGQKRARDEAAPDEGSDKPYGRGNPHRLGQGEIEMEILEALVDEG